MLPAERDDLIAQNMRLVPYVVNKYYADAATFFGFDELVSVGNVGLVKAAGSYNGSTKFSTYASACIRNEVQRFLNENRSMLHIPRDIARTMDSEQLQPFKVESIDALGFKDTADIRALRDESANFEDAVIARLDLEIALGLLTDKQRAMVVQRIAGNSARQIAKKFGFGTANVYYSLDAFKDAYTTGQKRKRGKKNVKQTGK